MLALGFGFSGYLLPWNELSYYATLVGTQIPGTVPVVGEFLLHLLRGGDQVSGDTITRFYAAHVMLLPLTLGFFLAVHLGLVQMQGMSLPLGMGSDKVRDHRPFFSEFLLIDASVWLLLLAAMVTLSFVMPAEVGVEADPLKPAPQGIKPEWYFLFLFQTLKQVPEMVGVLFFLSVGAFLLLIPFIDRRAAREEKSRWLFFVVLALLGYAATFETIALLAPGISHPPEELVAESYDWPGGIALLVLMWMVVAYLVYYLRQLLVLNTHLRWLYGNSPVAADLPASHSAGIPD
jgi:cytochrome b6